MSPKAYLPTPRTRVRRRHTQVRGLDRRPGLHPGYLAEAQSVDPREYPDLYPFRGARRVTSFPGTPLSLHSVAGDLFCFTLEGDSLYLSRHGRAINYHIPFPSADQTKERQLVQFNHYEGESPLLGSFRHLCLVYPDRLYFDLDDENPTVSSLESLSNSPALRLACVHVSRLFGAAEDRLYASAYNDPTNWNLDTATDIGAAAAWTATVQANPLSSGGFTALAVHDGHVLAFKKNFCHIINNTQNPFRIADLLAVGASSQSTVAEVDGVLFFADDRHIYRYNGESAEPVGDLLGNLDLKGAQAAAHGGLYYIYVPSVGRVFLWSEKTRAWGDMGALARRILAMAATEEGCYYLSTDGGLYLTDATGLVSFRYEFSPTVEEGEGEVRFSRLYLTLHDSLGDRLDVSYVDTSQRETPLLTHYGKNKLSHLVSRVMTPADRGGHLVIAGSGPTYRIHEIGLAVLMDAP